MCVHATAVTDSQNIARSSACVQWPAVTTVERTPFRPAVARCAVERSDEYLCTGRAYHRHYSEISKQDIWIRSTFRTYSS